MTKNVNATEPRHYSIATLPGDGIGNEVVPAAIAVLDAVGAIHGVSFDWRHQEWGCD
jgi:tartrate dehydrogenase/decarboxylase/D-malate dehydrogenase